MEFRGLTEIFKKSLANFHKPRVKSTSTVNYFDIKHSGEPA
jgi:hypothetical protein